MHWQVDDIEDDIAEKFYKLAFWTIIDDHFAKYYNQVQETHNNCFSLKKCYTTIHEAKTDKHKCYKFLTFDGVILQSGHQSCCRWYWNFLILFYMFVCK